METETILKKTDKRSWVLRVPGKGKDPVLSRVTMGPSGVDPGTGEEEREEE